MCIKVCIVITLRIFDFKSNSNTSHIQLKKTETAIPMKVLAYMKQYINVFYKKEVMECFGILEVHVIFIILAFQLNGL